MGLAEGAKDRSAEESVSGRGGSNRKKEQKLVEHGEDEANKGEKAITKTWSDMVKGLKTEDELETSKFGCERKPIVDSRFASYV